jgi:membrane protein DedA with SNARE-associated domain
MNSHVALTFMDFVEVHRMIGYFLLFFGIMIEGEAILLVFSFLASQGYFSIDVVMLITFLGVIIGDNIWYEAGKRYGQALYDKIGKHFITPVLFEKIRRNIREHNFKYIFFSKFIYGLNHFVILMAGHEKEDPKKIMKMDMLGTIPWIFIVSTIGYSFGYALKIFKHLRLELTVAGIVLLIAFIFAEKYIKKLFARPNKEHDH